MACEGEGQRCEVKEGRREADDDDQDGGEDFVKMIQGQLNAMSAYTSGS